MSRCPWAKGEAYERYHDTEWGVPVHDDRVLFEFLILEGAQAGLSWSTILAKRKNYRKAFADFDPVRIARFTEDKLEKLLLDPGIVRNRLKVFGAVKNAKAYLALKKDFPKADQPLAEFLWKFVDPSGKHQPIVNHPRTSKDVPASTPVSDAMSKALKKRGFTFVGSTIMYAFMQATGMVNDHLMSCACRARA